jgi:hypothetical protein
MTTTEITQTIAPELPADFEFAGEWAVEADGALLVLFKDNDHTAGAVAQAVSTLSSRVREALAQGTEVTVRALSVAEFQATCDHTFLLADGECWRCGVMVG